MWTQFGLRWKASVIVDAETWNWEICAGHEPTQDDISAGKYDAMTAAFWAPLKVTMTKLQKSGETHVSELSVARKGTVYGAYGLGLTLATSDDSASPRRDSRDVRFGLKISP
jgi:hypothetical protein